jgi:RNA polymerase sigma-70 factor (ECF subfamily)
VKVKDNVATQCAEYTTIEDDKLLILIGNKQDRCALAELYARYRQPVARFLLRGLRENSLVEEIYNDVMLTVWHKSNSFRGESNVSTWIFAIAYRQRLSHSRKESKHEHTGPNELQYVLEPAENFTLNETIEAAIVELSEQHRSVIELTYFHGYRSAEVAVILRCPQNTVKTRLFHARKKLKATLETNHSMPGTR